MQNPFNRRIIPARLANRLAMALVVGINLLLPSCPIHADDTNSLPMLTPEARDAIEKGLTQFRDNKFDEAEKTFQKVTEMVPNHPMGWKQHWLRSAKRSISTPAMRVLICILVY